MEPAPVSDFDAEINALRAVVDALTCVPSEARARILAYAHQRFPASQFPAYDASLKAIHQAQSSQRGLG